VTVADGSSSDVVVRGAPDALLRWVWNREMPGSQTELPDFRQFVAIATQ
jgi:hypothetical protein